ncbi:MAG TPA: NAD-dependent epimerase/dehydratase family protein [Frankiaceae bacterium]|nr:NAD-dependent epimerase/dehydratase family protein [Frankiaceae bacterium]
MRVLVTGAAGFVGSHYVRTMVSGGYPSVGPVEVTVYDRLTGAGNLENLAPVAGRFRFVQGDVSDAGLLDDVLPGHDAVVNFAVETSGTDEDLLVTNALGASTLFGACRRAGVARVVHISTAEVYGTDVYRTASGAVSEDARLDPATPFAASKAAGDLVARVAATEGLPVCVTRSPELYGPYSGPMAPLPALLTGLLEGERPEPSSRSRDWLHVDDHCRAVQLVLERGRPGDVFNIGGATEISDPELLERLIAVTGCRRPERWAAHVRPGRRLDDTKIRRLGYRPLVDFEEGLTATVQWYRDNDAWWRPLREKLPAG